MSKRILAKLDSAGIVVQKPSETISILFRCLSIQILKPQYYLGDFLDEAHFFNDTFPLKMISSPSILSTIEVHSWEKLILQFHFTPYEQLFHF